MRPDGFLVRADARVKITVTAAALVVVLTAQRPLAGLAVAGFALASLAASGGRAALRTFVRPLGGLLVTAGIPLALLYGYRGADGAALVGARILGATAAGFWLVRSTELAPLQGALIWLRVPRALVELLGLAHRYVAVFREVLDTARDAQTLRLGYAGARRGLRSVGALAGIVFSRAIDQTARLADALALRGWQGQLEFTPPAPLDARDAQVAGASTVALLVSAWLGVVA